MEELGSCIICTDPTTGSVVTRCGHRFCGHCIVGWMERTNTCPVCRKAVADDELVNDPDFEQLATIVRDDSQSATSDRRKSETFARLCHCSLCSNILVGAALTICGHRFCAHCIRQRLEDRKRCPNCRQPLSDTDLICDPDFDALTALLKTQIERRTNESQGTSSNIGTSINESQGTSSNIGTRNNVNMGTSTNASSNGGSRNNDNLRTNTNSNSDAAARNSPETGGTRRDTLVQTNRMPLTQTPDNARLGPDNRSESNQGQTETARVVNQSVPNSGLQGNLSERNQSGLNRTPQINAGERNQFLATSSLQANTAASNQSDANRNPPVTTAGGNQSEVNRSSQLNETGNQSDANRGPQAEDTTQSGINTNPQVTTSEENQSRANRHPLHRGESTRFEELCNCPICADVINEAKITPCGHRFCTGCIRHWLRGHNTCPTCRNRVTISELMRDNTFDEMIAFMRSQLDSRQSRNTPRSRDLDEINDELTQSREDSSRLMDQLQNTFDRLDEYERMFRDKDQELVRLRAEANRITALENAIAEVAGQLTTARAGAERLQNEVERLRAFEQQCADKDAELNRLNAQVMPEKDAEIVYLQSEVSNTTETMERAMADHQELQASMSRLNEEYQTALACNRQLKAEVQRRGEDTARCQQAITLLKQLYQAKDGEVQALTGTVIPEKDETIRGLQETNTDLNAQLTALRASIITLQEIRAVPGSRLYHAIEKLQRFYDREFRTKIGVTEDIINTLDLHLEVTTQELQNNENLGDNLALAIGTYISLIEENASLLCTVRKHDQEVNNLKLQLRNTTGRQLELQKKLKVQEICAEE